MVNWWIDFLKLAAQWVNNNNNNNNNNNDDDDDDD